MAEVSVESFKGRLRLRWRVEGHRYCLSLGLDDTPNNAAIARLQASEIEKDIRQEVFDPNLEKYRGKRVGKSLRVYEVFEKFIDHKRGEVYKQTLTKYNGLLSSLKTHFGDKSIGQLTAADCQQFKQWLAGRIVARTLKEQLTMLSSAWDWAVEHRKVAMNPWKGMAKQVKPGPVPPPNPFSIEEIQRIVQTFRNHPSYGFYADYTEFLLGSGCRIGEAIALTWGDITDDCSQIWFGKTYYRGDEKELKAGQAGFVPLSRGLQELLQRRRPPNASPQMLVFPAPRGGHLDDKNFCNRAWKSILSAAGVPYRKPYTSRKTLITYWLSQGEDPLIVAKFTRTSVRMIYRHYAGYIPSKATLPNLPLDSVFPTSSSSNTGNELLI